MSDLRTFLLARIEDDKDFWQLVEVLNQASSDRIRRGRSQAQATADIVERHHEHELTGFCDCCFDDYPCADLRTLGAIYDQHPDYREEWRP